MYKKLLIGIAILTIAIFSCSICFANNGLQNTAEDVRNVVGGAENTVENAVKDISNTSKNATGNLEKDFNNMDTHNTTNTEETATTDGNYTANRTSTTANSTFMGMNATAWTWLIIGIAAIAIVALVWYYSMQVHSSNSKD